MAATFWKITDTENENCIVTKNGLVLNQTEPDEKLKESICKAAEGAYVESFYEYSGEDFFGDHEYFTRTSKITADSAPGLDYILYENELAGFLIDYNSGVSGGAFILSEFSLMFPGEYVYVNESNSSSSRTKTTYRLVEENPIPPRKPLKDTGERAEYACINLGEMGDFYVCADMPFDEFLRVACASRMQTYVSYSARFTRDRKYYWEYTSETERTAGLIPIGVEADFHLITEEKGVFSLSFACGEHKMLDVAEYGRVYLIGSGRLC